MKTRKSKLKSPKYLSNTKKRIILLSILLIASSLGIFATFLLSRQSIKLKTNSSTTSNCSQNTPSSHALTDIGEPRDVAVDDVTSEADNDSEVSFKDVNPLTIKDEQLPAFKKYYEAISGDSYNDLNKERIATQINLLTKQLLHQTNGMSKYDFQISNYLDNYPTHLTHLFDLLKGNQLFELIYEMSSRTINLRPGDIDLTWYNLEPGYYGYKKTKEIKTYYLPGLRRLYVSCEILIQIIENNYQHFKNKTLVHFLLVFMKLIWTEFEDLLGNRKFESDKQYYFDWSLEKKTKFYLLDGENSFSNHIIVLACYTVIKELYENFQSELDDQIKKHLKRILDIINFIENKFNEIIGRIYILVEIIEKYIDTIGLGDFRDIFFKIGIELENFYNSVRPF
eukprot:GAHX01002645.1.p1 GENE.GAHX01002645.1~~GAHX01002645.1.p1  ORF type:complete len:396 (+),score=56.88 GAHX01002645.1:296-1483(+)